MILLYYQNYMKNTLKNPKIQYIYENIIFDLEKKKRIDKNKKIKLKFELNNLDKLCDENKKINKNIVLPIRKIDIYEARIASNWDILYMPPADIYVVKRFRELYAVNRDVYEREIDQLAYSVRSDNLK